MYYLKVSLRVRSKIKFVRDRSFGVRFLRGVIRTERRCEHDESLLRHWVRLRTGCIFSLLSVEGGAVRT